MKRDQFVSIFFIALLVFVVYQVVLIFSPFFKAIFWSAILSFAFYPLYKKLQYRISSEVPAAIIMTVLIFFIVIPPLVLLFVNLTTQTIELYQAVLDYIRAGGLERLIDQVRSIGLIRNIEAQILEKEFLKENTTVWLLNSSRNIGNFAAAQAGTITKNLLFVFLNMMLTIFVIFFFLKDGQRIYDFIYQVVPISEKHKKLVFERINETFSAVIRGQLLTSFTQAFVAGIAFWFLGLPVPIFFAAITFIGAMIPIVGASAVWFPLVIYLVTLNQTTKALVLFLFGVLVISLIDNIMKPALIGEKTKLPYLMLFFGILGGLKIYGLMGVFLAPVVMSLFFALVGIYKTKTW